MMAHSTRSVPQRSVRSLPRHEASNASASTSTSGTTRVVKRPPRAKTERRREQCRRNQARYRNKQRLTEYELENNVEELRRQVERLRIQRVHWELNLVGGLHAVLSLPEVAVELKQSRTAHDAVLLESGDVFMPTYSAARAVDKELTSFVDTQEGMTDKIAGPRGHGEACMDCASETTWMLCGAQEGAAQATK